MRSAQGPVLASLRPRESDREPGWRDRVVAHLRAHSLDRELSVGIAGWRSRNHAARALQLSSERYRRALARSLETLLEHAEEPRVHNTSAVVAPCRAQVVEARPQILGIASRLRSGEPVDAGGMARLGQLLRDGAGPCYRPSRPGALVVQLQAVSAWLDVRD